MSRVLGGRKLTRRDFLKLGGALAGNSALGASLPRDTGSQTLGRSNVVVILTDDQDVASVERMTNVRRLLADRGVSFTNSCTSFPLCSPSRAAFLTGQYGHNNSVLSNKDTEGLREEETLPVWLRQAGYETAHIGKYLNRYNTEAPARIPPGWSEWYGSVDPSTYRMWGYTLNENGKLRTYGREDVEDPDLYQTDVYARKAVDYVERRASSGRPFFLSFAPLAPHFEVVENKEIVGERNPRPAPRHRGAYKGAQAPRTPGFDEADVSDKPAFVRKKPRLDRRAVAQINRDYRSRLEALRAVDEAVKSIVDALGSAGVLDNTLIVFASDNGWMYGQHRIPDRKQVHYEESIRVPLIMRGPGIPQGERRVQLASNVDLAPTILDAAGARAGATVDGISLLPFARPRRPQPREILLETGSGRYLTDPYAAVRTDEAKYVEYKTGETELYDLRRDPHELTSRHDDRAYRGVRRLLAARLEELRNCRGDSCRTGGDPRDARRFEAQDLQQALQEARGRNSGKPERRASGGRERRTERRRGRQG